MFHVSINILWSNAVECYREHCARAGSGLYNQIIAFQNDLTFENTNSIGFKSGLYGGKNLMSAPTLVIMSR